MNGAGGLAAGVTHERCCTVNYCDLIDFRSIKRECILLRIDDVLVFALARKHIPTNEENDNLNNALTIYFIRKLVVLFSERIVNMPFEIYENF